MAKVTQQQVNAEVARLDQIMKELAWSQGQRIKMERDLNRNGDSSEADFWRSVGWWEGRIDERN